MNTECPNDDISKKNQEVSNRYYSLLDDIVRNTQSMIMPIVEIDGKYHKVESFDSDNIHVIAKGIRAEGMKLSVGDSIIITEQYNKTTYGEVIGIFRQSRKLLIKLYDYNKIFSFDNIIKLEKTKEIKSTKSLMNQKIKVGDTVFVYHNDIEYKEMKVKKIMRGEQSGKEIATLDRGAFRRNLYREPKYLIKKDSDDIFVDKNNNIIDARSFTGLGIMDNNQNIYNYNDVSIKKPKKKK